MARPVDRRVRALSVGLFIFRVFTISRTGLNAELKVSLWLHKKERVAALVERGSQDFDAGDFKGSLILFAARKKLIILILKLIVGRLAA